MPSANKCLTELKDEIRHHPIDRKRRQNKRDAQMSSPGRHGGQLNRLMAVTMSNRRETCSDPASRQLKKGSNI
uniref:Uncharacterized protein n=1 Tax=Romanomermis culicivorax TaxID=13658 RepID=A0A915ITX0_ROMCU